MSKSDRIIPEMFVHDGSGAVDFYKRAFGATIERAITAGAKVLMAVQDIFWGARYGKLIDPYGHEWGINQQVKQLTEAEEADRAQQYFSKK